MKKNLSVLVAALCCFLFFAGVSMAAEISDPILKKLVEKGVLTKEEAVNVSAGDGEGCLKESPKV